MHLLIFFVSSSQLLLLLLIVSCPLCCCGCVAFQPAPPLTRSEGSSCVMRGRERERGGGLRKCVNLLDLGVEIDLIVEPTIVLSSSQLGTVEGFPQVFGRQLTTGKIENEGGKG